MSQFWKRAAVPALSAIAFLGPLAGSSEATTTPGVNATPHNSSSHPWSTDGCSVVPDWGLWGGAWFDFNHACIHHDGCYRNRWASKGTCDTWFLNDMNASCGALHPWWSARRGACKDLAWKYYLGVVYFGGGAYSSRSGYIPMNQYA